MSLEKPFAATMHCTQTNKKEENRKWINALLSTHTWISNQTLWGLHQKVVKLDRSFFTQTDSYYRLLQRVGDLLGHRALTQGGLNNPLCPRWVPSFCGWRDCHLQGKLTGSSRPTLVAFGWCCGSSCPPVPPSLTAYPAGAEDVTQVPGLKNAVLTVDQAKSTLEAGFPCLTRGFSMCLLVNVNLWVMEAASVLSLVTRP